MDILNDNQLEERASNKLEAKMFFAIKELEKIRLQIMGVIGSKVGNDILEKNFLAQSYEVQVLRYMIQKINENNCKKTCEN
tara:strand:+ start:2315 stop:2557 length:243 start_codon:yes stop_codon:yes gene_type:complete